jgi:sporulation integral membrane protein YlbJ
MNVLILFILTAIFILIFVLLKKLQGSITISLIASILIACFIFFPKLCLTSTLEGTKLFFSSVFPSIFPFIIMCNILLSFQGIMIYSKLLGNILCKPLRLPNNCGFVIFVSALCGNPLGAKYSIELYEKRLITQEQCDRLLSIASNVSPLFAIGAVGTVMLKSSLFGYILLISNYLSCLLIGLLLSLKAPKDIKYSAIQPLKQADSPNLGNVLKESIENAIKTTLSVGGYIVIFYVIIDLIGNSTLFSYITNLFLSNSSDFKGIVSGSLLGIIELTKGCHILSQSSMQTSLKISFIGFLMGFSGFSIITQVYSFTSKYTEFKISLYIKRKLIQGIINSLITFFILEFISYKQLAAIQAFSSPGHAKVLSISTILIILLSPILIRALKTYVQSKKF